MAHGFELEIIRSHNLAADTAKYPTRRVPLQWVDGRWFDEKRMLNDGTRMVDRGAVCGFEEGLCKVGVQVSGESTRVDSMQEDKVSLALATFLCTSRFCLGGLILGVQDTTDNDVGRKITQRDSQSWIVASAEQLLADGIFSREVCAYLRAIEQCFCLDGRG